VQVTVDTRGLTDLQARLPLLSQIIRKAALDVEANAKVAIQTGTKSGRLYRRGSRVHQASAPGEAPATDTSFLVNSIGMRPAGKDAYEVKAAAKYALPLEVGTARVAARPFMVPALLKVKPVLEKAVRKLILGGTS
jgi:hypothetical protein